MIQINYHINLQQIDCYLALAPETSFLFTSLDSALTSLAQFRYAKPYTIIMTERT